jgi:DNA repair protein RadC
VFQIPEDLFLRKMSYRQAMQVVEDVERLGEVMRDGKEDYMLVRAVFVALAATMLRQLGSMKLAMDADEQLLAQVEAVQLEYLQDAKAVGERRLRQYHSKRRKGTADSTSDEDDEKPSMAVVPWGDRRPPRHTPPHAVAS